MYVECTFGRLKAKFGCLKRGMDINLNGSPYAIHACFILQNSCEINKFQPCRVLLLLFSLLLRNIQTIEQYENQDETNEN